MAQTTVEEVFEKLKPVYGAKKMSALWFAYLSEDADGKRDIEATLRMMYVKSLGETFEKQQVLLTSGL